MKRVDEQKNWSDMYVYEAHVVEDLMALVAEFVGECEHHGQVANCKEISKDTILNVEDWIKRRKELLRKDFIGYWSDID